MPLVCTNQYCGFRLKNSIDFLVGKLELALKPLILTERQAVGAITPPQLFETGVYRASAPYYTPISYPITQRGSECKVACPEAMNLDCAHHTFTFLCFKLWNCTMHTNPSDVAASNGKVDQEQS